MQTKVIRWNIDIYAQDEYLISASKHILNTQSDEYVAFIDSMISTLEMRDYLFSESSYRQNKTKDGVSEYYEFIKFTDELKIKLIIYIRVSDHPLPYKPSAKIPNGERRQRHYYITERTPKLMREFDTDKIPASISVYITFDGKRFTSYDDAIIYLTKRINDLPD